MGDIANLTTAITSAAMPWIALLFSIVVTIWIKDWATNLAKGWSFLKSPAFNPGDKVYIDGEPAMIISIGLTKTIFEIERDSKTVWRYIPNHRIDFVKIEKIVDK
jgi:hypothetical protein